MRRAEIEHATIPFYEARLAAHEGERRFEHFDIKMPSLKGLDPNLSISEQLDVLRTEVRRNLY